MKKIYFLFIFLCLYSSVRAQIINIPDANFKMWLLTASGTPTNTSQARDQNGNSLFIDANHDGEIQISEAQMVYELRINNPVYNKISSVEGIHYFTNLRFLTLSQNLISTVNLSELVNLKTLYLGGNQLSSFNFTGLINLESFDVSDNNITTLDFSGLTNIRQISCSNNLLSNINVVGLNNLQEFFVNNNNLSYINLSGLSNLIRLFCGNNQLTQLNLYGLNKLDDLRCQNNLLTTLDLSDLNLLSLFNCESNNLSYINMKNGIFQTAVFDNNPNLNFICADDDEYQQIQFRLNLYGYQNCNFNSYCSFNPGGVYYNIQGNNKFDSNNDGCDLIDSSIPNLKYMITNGTISGSFISNTSGNHSISVSGGTHTITPVLENPSYFAISPSNVVVDFPTQASPFTQNFCISPNGNHQDLEVVLLPLIPSRPGFDAVFKIIYKNKGTITQSGSVVMDYFSDRADFISSVPTISNISNNLLTWNFTNLKPFETREITFTVNINSPMEIPAVNIGDILSFEAYVYPLIGDLTPENNHNGIRQIVVGSYDPNDKTCLEGDMITPDRVGEFVHYMIRFENNGTANAHNIVVKDMIDTNKFDVNSLVVLKGSHNYYTRINGDKVEFIFENINLPFDNANNDGYVSFKIKTNPTLTNGDTFSNSASIYFDYNFPILTNTATTTIQALSSQDFEFSNYFNLYPNPVSTTLKIDAKNAIQISSINIYNTLGQLVLVVPNAQETKIVDVSSLSSGNYFIKINSDKGTSNTKFIKQ